MSEEQEVEKPKRSYVTNTELQLELKALRSDLRLLVIGSLVASQVLNNVTIPGTVTAVVGVGGAVWVAAKIGVAAFLGAR